MKQKLNFLNVNIAKSIFAATLLVSFSCSQDEGFENIDSTLTTELESNDNNLALKRQGKQISGCDNPGGFQYYTYGETSSSNTDSQDLVNQTAENGTNVYSMRFLDDRTCSYNYSQNGNRGIYRIAAGSNDYNTTLQPRIERQAKVVDRKNGNFVSVEGTVKIKRVGNKETGNYPNSDVRDQKGSYIIQAKGNHSNVTIGSSDPAILLVLAKDKGNGTIDLWSEQITKRGGSGIDGRKLEFIKNVTKNDEFDIKMVNGWSTNTKQYVNIYINDILEHTFNIPNTRVTINGVRKYQTGKNAKIRFGVYRCVKGEANIEWSNVKHDFLDN